MGNTNNVFTEVHAMVTSKSAGIIEVVQEDSDARQPIDLATVACDWELHAGDAVLLHVCNGKVGKIELPDSIEYVDGVIREAHEQYGIINDNIIFFADALKAFSEFTTGDSVKCSVIRGYYANSAGESFERRCLSLWTGRASLPDSNGSNGTLAAAKSDGTTIAKPASEPALSAKLEFTATALRARQEYYNLPDGLVEVVKWKNLNRVNEKLDEFLCVGPLAMANYAQRLHGLLHLEEAEVKIGFDRYKMDKLLMPQGKSRFMLPYANTQELRPPIQPGDIVIVSALAGAQRSFRGKVDAVNADHFMIRMGDRFEENMSADGFSISFNYNRAAFRRKHRAVDLAVEQFDDRLLFPSALCPNASAGRTVHVAERRLYVDGSAVEWFQGHLNDRQIGAVVSALRAACNLPFIIYGPPGTGKTSTLVEIILQIHAHWPAARVLVTTQTNSAANIVATRLIKSCAAVSTTLIRMVSSSSAKKHCLPDELKAYSRLVHRYQEPDDTDAGNNEGDIINCDVDTLDGYRIFITTCVGAGIIQGTRLDHDFFTHVICDEASQCTEPDTLIPIACLNQTTGRIVMAGDPNQLPPMVLNRFAAARGLKQSLFERFYERYTQMLAAKQQDESDDRLFVRLECSYRALRSIMDFYSAQFYESRMRARVCNETSTEAKLLTKIQRDKVVPRTGDSCADQTGPFGLYFVDVEKGRDHRQAGSTSWLNDAEAELIKTMVLKLLAAGFKDSDIGIITPYQAQVQHIQRKLGGRNGIRVGSVEVFQGDEKQIILMSCVRTCGKLESLQFVLCPKRMNTAISRPRMLLMVFGCADLFATASNWAALMEYCRRNGTFLNAGDLC